MENQLKVGQVIELVKVMKSGGYHKGRFVPGTLRPVELKSGESYPLANRIEKDKNPVDVWDYVMFTGSQIMTFNEEIKPWGRMVITKIK